ncbi:unnamed protein product [Prunus armeniaca]
MPHVLEKGVALITGSVGKMPKATIARLNLVHVSSPYRLFILRVMLDPCPSALLYSEADTQEPKGCHFEVK